VLVPVLNDWEIEGLVFIIWHWRTSTNNVFLRSWIDELKLRVGEIPRIAGMLVSGQSFYTQMDGGTVDITACAIRDLRIAYGHDS